MAKVQAEYKEINCSNCGKDMNSPNGQAALMSFSFNLNNHPDEPHFTEEFLKKQIGDYELGKNYALCWECTLKGFGFKP